MKEECEVRSIKETYFKMGLNDWLKLHSAFLWKTLQLLWHPGNPDPNPCEETAFHCWHRCFKNVSELLNRIMNIKATIRLHKFKLSLLTWFESIFYSENSFSDTISKLSLVLESLHFQTLHPVQPKFTIWFRKPTKL